MVAISRQNRLCFFTTTRQKPHECTCVHIPDASDKFQPKETSYMFGDYNKPGDGEGSTSAEAEALLSQTQAGSSGSFNEGAKKNSDGTFHIRFWQQ